MNRPYTICHIFSGLDGAITGSFMDMPECAGALKHYGRLRSTFECNAILYGTTTMLDFCEGVVSNLPKGKKIEFKDYASSCNNGKYMVAIDQKGELAYSKNCIERHNTSFHIIEVLTEQVSNEYLNYLQEREISYIFAGKSEIDCEMVMKKLKDAFNIERLMIAGGGHIDWTFGAAGMIDELSLVLAPTADGENGVTVFEKMDSLQKSALSFSLKDVQRLEGDTVWLRYRFNNARR